LRVVPRMGAFEGALPRQEAEPLGDRGHCLGDLVPLATELVVLPLQIFELPAKPLDFLLGRAHPLVGMGVGHEQLRQHAEQLPGLPVSFSAGQTLRTLRIRFATSSAVSWAKPFTSTTPAPSSRPSPYVFQRSSSAISRPANSSTSWWARDFRIPGKYGSYVRWKRERPSG